MCFIFPKIISLFNARAGITWTHEEEERQCSLHPPSRSLSTGQGREKINVSIPRIPCSKSPLSEGTKGLSNIYKAALMCSCLLQTASLQIPGQAASMQGSTSGQLSLFLSPNHSKFYWSHILNWSSHPQGENKKNHCRFGFFLLSYIFTLYNSDCYLWGLSGKVSTILSLLGLEVIRVRVHLYFWSLAPQCPPGLGTLLWQSRNIIL